MFKKTKAETPAPVEEKKEKPTPAYLREDYPYPAVGDVITDLSTLEPTGVLYELRCTNCQMSVRTQGVNMKSIYERFMDGGCIGCKEKKFELKRVDMSKMEKA